MVAAPAPLRHETRGRTTTSAAMPHAVLRTALLARLLAEEPPGQSDRGQADHAPLQHALAGWPRRLLAYQRAIHLRLRRRRRAGPVPPFRRRNPADDERVRFGGAGRAARRVVHFLTVETEPGCAELHPSSVKVKPVNW